MIDIFSIFKNKRTIPGLSKEDMSDLLFLVSMHLERDDLEDAAKDKYFRLKNKLLRIICSDWE